MGKPNNIFIVTRIVHDPCSCCTADPIVCVEDEEGAQNLAMRLNAVTKASVENHFGVVPVMMGKTEDEILDEIFAEEISYYQEQYRNCPMSEIPQEYHPNSKEMIEWDDQ